MNFLLFVVARSLFAQTHLRAKRRILWWGNALVLSLAGLILAPSSAHADALATPAAAKASSTQAEPPLQKPDDLRWQLDAIPSKLPPDGDARKLLTQLSDIGIAADRLAKRRTEELTDVDGRLSGLGPAPENGAPTDAPDVVQQRATLTKQRSAIDSDLKLARLVSVDAEQRSNEILKQRRAQFQAAITARVSTPLSPVFWRKWQENVLDDLERLHMLGQELGSAVEEAMSTAAGRSSFIAHVLGALLLFFGGLWAAERVLVRMLPSHLPSGRLRRTLLATCSILANVVIVAIAVNIAWNGVLLNVDSDERLRTLERICVQMAAYATYVITLGHVLLAVKHSSWRLLPISDDLAKRLSPFPWWFAISSAISGLATEISALAGWSIASEVMVQTIFALVTAVVTLLSLRHLRSVHTNALQNPGDAQSHASQAPFCADSDPPWWFALLAAAAGLTVIAILVSLALGFVALSATMARQMVWTIVLLSSMYLLFKLADDLCETLLSSKGSVGGRLQTALGLEPRLLDQVAVVLSGAVRLALFIYMVIALFTPLGTAPDEVFRRGSTLNHDLKIGEFIIAPQSLLTAVAVMCLGFLAIHLFKRWLTQRYFPNTTLEPGMRSSITTLLGYVGGVVVIAAALAGLGISVERIAWVASALSVGIGFGLQAIVQNFISGLILLAERPVRVGDWVILGDTEGDVRRVNVRATEIQLFDRSTMIVPNSEFITKSVRNMTLSGTPGRVLMRLPAPLDTDTERMRQIILDAYNNHAAVQPTPAPIVQLEGIQSGTLTFLAIGYISNPRDISTVRSDLLFTILKALREAGLYLSPPATTSVAKPDANSGTGDPVVDQLTGQR